MNSSRSIDHRTESFLLDARSCNPFFTYGVVTATFVSLVRDIQRSLMKKEKRKKNKTVAPVKSSVKYLTRTVALPFARIAT